MEEKICEAEMKKSANIIVISIWTNPRIYVAVHY
jgi:hypothetical protein